MLRCGPIGNSDALRDASAAFEALAQNIVDTLPRSPERTVALRKLLEATDAAVRAILIAPTQNAAGK